MRERRVKRKFDNLESQGRVVLLLECNHYLSIPLAAIQLSIDPEKLLHSGFGMCPTCPDPEPAPPPTPSPQQLWRDAGEP